jgi:hypothetical protein
MEATFQDNGLMLADPAGTLDRLRTLGVARVRMFVPWGAIAPDPTARQPPPGFVGGDPGAYPAARWAIWDEIVRDAQARGIGVDFDLTAGAPLWATGPGAPKHSARVQWEPSAGDFRLFVRAIGTRYSGSYDPITNSLAPGNPDDLPRVDYWAIWNEPNYGPGLAPQGSHNGKVEFSPWMYRNLVDAAWRSLQETGHRGDTILFGDLAPRGTNNFGIFSGMKPLRFLRAMYCLDAAYRQFRGTAAARRGCPTGAAGSRRFSHDHPALFQATGFADHPYSQSSAPNVEASPDPNFTSLAELSGLERALDRLQRSYGSRRRLPIYLTEYGYITRPPKRNTFKHNYVSPAVAAYYMNWAEYIAWRDPRVQTLTQYQLVDPLPATVSNDFGGYASGLIFYHGAHKPGYDAYRLPLYMPVTTASRGRKLEIWGCARPAGYAQIDTGEFQSVAIEFQRGSHRPFETVGTVPITSAGGYFDVSQAFAADGSVRLRWSYPDGQTVHSRVVPISLG